MCVISMRNHLIVKAMRAFVEATPEAQQEALDYLRAKVEEKKAREAKRCA